MAQILKYATRNSLIILDEVGRGTSTFDGMSIARAVMEYIHEKIKAKTLFATHYHQLIELENIMEGVKNYSVAVKERGNDIVFLRRIVRGGSDKSYGSVAVKERGNDIVFLRRIVRGGSDKSYGVHVARLGCTPGGAAEEGA